MELILILIVAGVAGYFLGKSKWGKNVDDAAGKVTETSKGVADNVEGWVRNRFGQGRDVVDVEAKDVDEPEGSEDGKKPAEKTVSRRKSKAAEETEEAPAPPES